MLLSKGHCLLKDKILSFM